MIDSTPLVSVIYPVFNDNPEYIKESLKSIVNQTYPDIEILVIEDSTEQASINAVRSYNSDPRIKILKNEGQGLSSALNTGIRQSGGTLLARADADDILHPDRIKEQVDFMIQNPTIGILGCNVNYVDVNNTPLKLRKYPEYDIDIRTAIHIRNPICHSAVMLRKSIFNIIEPYDTSYKRAEDYELWMRASNKQIQFHNLQSVLLNYRMASGYKRDRQNWLINLKIKFHYFSFRRLIPSIWGITTVGLYLITPVWIQNFIYRKLA